MNIIYWILFGFIAGSISNYIMPSQKGGFLATVVLGVVGAVVGGFLAEQIFGIGITGFNIPSMLIAVAGGMLVVFVSRRLIKE